MDEVVRAIQESESIGHEILSIKSEIINLDEKRQKDRQAVRALSTTRTDGEEKTWIQAGNLFVKTRTETAKLLIARDEKDLETGISDLRDRLKERMDALNRLEGKRSLPAPQKPLSRAERSALSSLLPVTSDLDFRS